MSKDLDHQIKLLQQKIQILELEVQIAERKLALEKMRGYQNPYTYPYITWTSTGGGNGVLGTSYQVTS